MTTTVEPGRTDLLPGESATITAGERGHETLPLLLLLLPTFDVCVGAMRGINDGRTAHAPGATLPLSTCASCPRQWFRTSEQTKTASAHQYSKQKMCIVHRASVLQILLVSDFGDEVRPGSQGLPHKKLWTLLVREGKNCKAEHKQTSVHMVR